MNRVILKQLHIKNFGPIIEDTVNFGDFTYFVGRNNSGKSHYLRALELLLSSKNPEKEEIAKLQNDITKPIEIRGYFEGVANFTSLVSKSNHKTAIEEAIKDGLLCVARILDPNNDENTKFGVYRDDGSINNPSGFSSNLLKVLPDPIVIVATADTVDELRNKSNTALSKLKKEVLISFFTELREKTKTALSSLDDFLHGANVAQRSSDLTKFEDSLKEELMGEFAGIIPSVEFEMPDEEVIAKEMKIFLDDGHRSEIEQKGHGLQRAILLAMLRVLAKHGTSYVDKPTPMFLIGEIETFLHPFAQKQLAGAFDSLTARYQVITSTHSPFIIFPKTISGYKRVIKDNKKGTKHIAFNDSLGIDGKAITRHLERRGNLEGLFADRVILIEGDHDQGFYQKLSEIFKIQPVPSKFTLFIKTNGKQELRQARNFYKQMGFEDVAAICDLDNLYSSDFKNLLDLLGLDVSLAEKLRKHIDWNDPGDPSLEYIVNKLKEKGEAENFDRLLSYLETNRIFVLYKGSPEMYYKNSKGSKSAWNDIEKEEDLLEPEYLKKLMGKVIS